MSNSCCFITSNSRKYFPGLKWNAKRGGTLLQQEKRGGSPSNPVKKQVCLWSLCEKHVFLLGFFFGPLWATWDLWGVWRLFVPHQVRVDFHSAGDLWGLQLSFLVENVRWNARSMSDLCQLGTTRRISKTVLYACFFLKPGGVSNLNTGCHGLQKSAHQIQ